MYVWHNTEALFCKQRCTEYYIFCVCVCVALGIQQEMRIRHIVTVACLALKHFSTLFHKRHDFRKTTLLNIKCVPIFS